MKRPVVSTEELLRANPQLQALWEKDRQIRLNQPSRTSEEFIAQALEMKSARLTVARKAAGQPKVADKPN